MSHFSQIKTQIRNLSALQTALTDLGIEWKAGPQQVRGYQGQTQVADLAIAQANQFDIGFRWNGQEYELVADLQYWQQPWSINGFLNRVTQRYALQTVLNETSKQGFQVAEQQQCEDGSVRLVVQRWGA
ncbi:protein of unknown function (DUF1257) [Rubidibacter lacunae KORDI 51-2]|uniref:DUF1257 domain-containing protein n=1 Tax=Rubidibacter lacunae KORDI 51-2 TaxID=582515 RepID=U5D803_9CHRO|nr:DUF1257 domain-containing protein [Rubidibacter lacunae]ERN40753.1 protein of unknown function (DUF1257) [Rubidibacter lacunae KORDI 51-2]